MKKKKVNLQGENNSSPSKHKQSQIEDCIVVFNEYLEYQKSLSERYRYHVCSIARLFLYYRFQLTRFCLNQIKINDITNFVHHYSRHESPYRTRNMATALRGFLQFLKFKDMVAIDFSGSIPPVAIWKQDRIPDFLSKKEIKELLNSCNKKTITGLRDYTILRLLLGLGLRACEVANLTIDDFDWTNGELIIHGKGAKISRLPLMQDLGDDLVAYLLKGRPTCSVRSFFVSKSQPFQQLKVQSINHIVGDAFNRAGIKKRGKAHIFRHTFAVQLLNSGASLQEVGEILRHQSIDTTAIYAKVDFNKLRTIARPWPKNANFRGAL